MLVDVNIETDGFLTILTLNRPEVRNALTASMCRTIADEVSVVKQQPHATVRAILIRANGPAFCAGADLGSTRAAATTDGGVYGGDFHESLHAMLRAIVAAEVPVIADVQGPAVGAGTQLALACDLRVGGEKAWFAVPAAALGFALDAWTINRARELLGGSVSRSMLIAHQRVSVDMATTLGFVALRGDSAQALEFAHTVAALAPMAMRQLKDVLNTADDGYQLSVRQQQLYDACWASEDVVEARVARREKRPPRFTGQ